MKNAIFCGEERSDKSSIQIGSKEKKNETASLLMPLLSFDT
jgi:hypothetical protein